MIRERSRPPKELIVALAECLLAHYQGRPLIDPYDVYQHLMDYWAETMQDDCYLIAADGWKAETYRVIETKKGKDDKPGKQIDKGWACDLIPKPLIVARYFAKQQAALDQLAADLEAVSAQTAELEEEHGGDEGAFSELDKVTKRNVTSRLQEVAGDLEAKDEAAALNEWLALNSREADLKKRLKDAETSLDSKAYVRYPGLNEAEIKALVVEGKWLASINAAIHGEMDRVSHALTDRGMELAERYERRLPMMHRLADELQEKVNGHLARMGFSWS